MTNYDAGVERLAGYLTSLPDRSQDMWIDAAYETWLLRRARAPEQDRQARALEPEAVESR
jgi:hypothetical protein